MKSANLNPVSTRINISSPSDFEDVVGYSRAVRIGDHIAVSGTTAAGPDGTAVGGDDIGAQSREALTRIATALREAGADLSDVIRTRIFVTDITRWPEVAAAHAEFFGTIRPAASMYEVKGFITPALLVEIEADAIVTN